jgi:hypothetical protein
MAAPTQTMPPKIGRQNFYVPPDSRSVHPPARAKPLQIIGLSHGEKVSTFKAKRPMTGMETISTLRSFGQIFLL